MSAAACGGFVMTRATLDALRRARDLAIKAAAALAAGDTEKAEEAIADAAEQLDDLLNTERAALAGAA